MEVVHSAAVSSSDTSVVDVLHAAEEWSTWAPAIATVEVNGQEVQLLTHGPRPLSLTLNLTRRSDGIAVLLVEGDASALECDVSVVETDGGCEVLTVLRVEFPTTVPGSLVTELRDELVPRWIAALAVAAA